MPKRILIVRLSAIGDTIQSTPVARQIKQLYPDCHLAWVVEPKALPGIKHNPHLDEVFVLEPRKLSSWRALAPKIRGKFDITIDLQCLLKSGLVTALSASPIRIGRDDAREGAKMFYTRRMPTRRDHVYISQHYLEQCSELGLNIDDYVPELFPSPEDQAAAAKVWDELGLEGKHPVVALLPFSAEPTREWPMERFGQIGDQLAEEKGATCLIFGSPPEVPRAEALAAGMKHAPVIIAGKTSLGQAAALLARCDLAVGNDSGLPHYAFALGTPVVCAMGPSTTRSAPTSDKAIGIWSACEFRPCRPSDPCKRGDGRPCLEEVTMEQMFKAAVQLLESHPRRVAVGDGTRG
ncbi:MAG: glycosyltransferase family 9 protein [Armatimonadia bacterium]